MQSLSEWRRIRRYAVPDRMIAECSEARERGDWRAAPERRYALLPEGPIEPDAVVLTVRTPLSPDGSQRLTLEGLPAADLGTGRIAALPAYLWDARRAGGLRDAVGGAARRVPLFTPDGDPMPAEELGIGDDSPARAERVRRAPTPTEAAIAAGVEIVDIDVDRPRSDRDRILATVDPLRLAYDVRRLADQFRRTTWALWVDQHRYVQVDVDGDTVRITSPDPAQPARELPCLYADQVGFATDLDLVWRGRLTPADLHPLVRAALFPGAATPAAAEGFDSCVSADERIRVRCRGGDWHEISARAGRLDLLAHPPAEQQRERSVGCFAVEHAWHGTSGRLPKGLRAHREDLWLRMIHGGTRTVLDLLDAGMDPHLRDSRGRTLMHRICSFEHARLLPRLVQEGLDVNARDREGNTPLYIALVNRWPTDLVEALIESGADPHALNRDDLSVVEYVDRLLKYRHTRDARSEAVIAYLRPLTGSALAGGPVRRLQRWARTIMGD